jgi:hypothetical protein
MAGSHLTVATNPSRRPGAPFLAFFARKLALSSVEGWAFASQTDDKSGVAPMFIRHARDVALAEKKIRQSAGAVSEEYRRKSATGSGTGGPALTILAHRKTKRYFSTPTICDISTCPTPQTRRL